MAFGCSRTKTPQEMASRVIAEYADDPEGLTAEELDELGIAKDKHQLLLGTLKDGRVSKDEYKKLENGFSKDFADALHGSNGGEALQARVKWLGDNINQRWWRRDYDSDTRKKMIESLGKIGLAAKNAVPSLTEAMGDKDIDMRGAVVSTLGHIGPAA